MIGDVITNLNDVLGTINDKGDQFSTTIDQLQQLVSGLAQDSGPIANSITEIAGATGDLASLLGATRPDIQTLIGETNRTMTQLDLGKEDINTALARLPSDYQKLIRVGTYGSFFQFYLCANTFKFSGPDGTTIILPTAVQTTEGARRQNESYP